MIHLLTNNFFFYSITTLLDPEHSESDDEDVDQPKTISAKGSKGIKRKGRSTKNKDTTTKENDDESNANEPSTVIYLGHLPVGFEEREITVFLNQFGNVNKCRVSRSTKTGRSRGYAFVDFADPEVAQIVSETMSGYFLLEKRLVCHVLPKDKVHELMFTKPKRVPTKAEKQKKARSEVNNKQRSVDAMKGITAKLVKREEMKRKKLAELGIEYDFPGYAAGAAESMNTSNNTNEEKNITSSKKKKRKISEDGDDKVEEEKGDAMKMPKSSSKKKKKSKKESVEEEKENDDDVLNEEQDVVEPKSAAKKKKKSKTPKKGKTPKKA